MVVAPALPLTHRELMLASLAAKPFDRAGWVYELKYDGFRALAIRDGDGAHLSSRRGNDLGACFPEVVEDLSRLPPVVLDGELVVLDDQGKPQFDRLSRRARMSRPTSVREAARVDPAVLFVFDCLAYRGRDLRKLPLLQRKNHLRKAVEAAGPNARIRVVQHVGEGGTRLYEAASALELEGVVCKRADAPYRRGRSSDWVKVLTPAGRAAHAERAKWEER